MVRHASLHIQHSTFSGVGSFEKPNVSRKSTIKDEIVSQYTSNDVLLGKGKSNLKHPGNIKYQALIRDRCHEYRSIEPKARKRAFISGIIHKLAKSSRFLERMNDCGTTGCSQWRVLSPAKVRSKIGHALRFRFKQAEESGRSEASLGPVDPVGGESLGSNPPSSLEIQASYSNILFNMVHQDSKIQAQDFNDVPESRLPQVPLVGTSSQYHLNQQLRRLQGWRGALLTDRCALQGQPGSMYPTLDSAFGYPQSTRHDGNSLLAARQEQPAPSQPLYASPAIRDVCFCCQQDMDATISTTESTTTTSTTNRSTRSNTEDSSIEHANIDIILDSDIFFKNLLPSIDLLDIEDTLSLGDIDSVFDDHDDRHHRNQNNAKVSAKQVYPHDHDQFQGR